MVIFPVRCFTCGSVIGDKWEYFVNEVKKGRSMKEVLDELGIKRYCCRRMFISHVDLIDELVRYSRKV
ncbi:MAG: DNA-directed RNA polymerase subunit N [Zestosphaera tikiterensis]|uniref:DNA-directed RNA polymerase subunit Rpo10 n=1 Tax=Zestosphaera tikiterensis TaxID=1973259 RepID=A0A2R7Y3S1_9CREN|nr:MAG: DNA-directed RNA polymerase subunit N [Zestosphaera tikiterensis]